MLVKSGNFDMGQELQKPGNQDKKMLHIRSPEYLSTKIL